MSYARLTSTLFKTESKPILNKLADASKLAFLTAAEKNFEAKEYELALKNYDNYLQHQPYNLDVLFNKGTTLAALGRYIEAVEIFKHILLNKRKDPEIFNNYGAALLHLKQPELALTQFCLALDLRPNHENTWHNLGAAYYAMGNPAAALVSFDRALFINSVDEKIIQSRTIALKTAKRMSDAPVALPMFTQPVKDRTLVVAPKEEASPNSSSSHKRL